jgi:hypothetical protein
MKGNPLVMRDVAKAIADIDLKKQAKARAEAEAAEQVATKKAEQDKAWYLHLVDLRKQQVKAWARAASDGRQEPDQPWPHPDDVLINHTTRTVRVRGPMGSDDLEDWEYLRWNRDHHLARVVYHTSLVEPIHRMISKMWLIGLLECDLNLPERWQISREIMPASNRLMAMPFAKLEAMVAEGAAVFEGGSSSQRLSREDYSSVNRKWRPLIKMLGFRSLRHMERFGEEGA